MVFELTEEQRMIQEMARNVAQKEVLPKAAELDETGRFPGDLVRQMAELGLMGITVPEEYGGAGMDNICYAIAIEEIARACASTAVILSVNNSLACDPILSHPENTWAVSGSRSRERDPTPDPRRQRPFGTETITC